jgi:hypothetical protein
MRWRARLSAQSFSSTRSVVLLVQNRKLWLNFLAATTALCFRDLGIYQLDDRHRSGIAGSVSEAQNPSVTTLSSGKPWGDFIEQFLHDSIALYHLESLAACMEVPTLA